MLDPNKSDASFEKENLKPNLYKENLGIKPDSDNLKYQPLDLNENSWVEQPAKRRKSIVEYLKENKDHIKVITAGFIANFLYIISDRNCPLSNVDECAIKFIVANAPKWVIQILISATIFVIIIVKGIQRQISRFYSLIALLNIIYFCFYYHPVLNKQEYGQLFAIFLGIFVCLELLILAIVFPIRSCYRKSKSGTILGVFFVVSTCFLTFYFSRVYHNCANWSRGIGNEEIHADKPTCKIHQPELCIYDITEGWLDFSFFMTCSSYEAKKAILDQYYPNTPYVGFARTEKFTETERFTMQSSVFKNLVPLQTLSEPAADDMEIFLDKTSETQPTINIHIQRNETLVEERSKIKSQSLTKNLLVVYIDALSRAGSLRKLRKTMSWFDKYSQQKDSEAETFQFFKYHAITPYTTNNLYEALYGTLPFDSFVPQNNRIESFLKYYKENGFITGHAIDFCQISPLDIYANQIIKDVPYDHEGISFACDPHFHNPESPYSLFNGPYSSVRRCLYGKDLFEYTFEYGDQFWRTYKEEKKILYLDFLDAHEGTGEVVKYMDEALYNFINNLQRDKLLEDTTIIFFSDHGLHMQGLFYLLGYEVVSIEKALPTLYVTLPSNIASKYRTAIKENEQKLVYSHDIHDFFITVAEGENSSSLKTSIIGPLPPNRTCNDIFLREMQCVCTYD